MVGRACYLLLLLMGVWLIQILNFGVILIYCVFVWPNDGQLKWTRNELMETNSLT